MRLALTLLAAATFTGTQVDQGMPGTQPWPVVAKSVPYPDGGSSGSQNVNPAAQTSGQISQVLCQGVVATLIDGNPRRYLLIVNPPGGDTVWISNSATITVPLNAFPLPGGSSVSYDAASSIPFYCIDPTVALPDAGGVQGDGGGIYFSEVN